MGNQPTSEEKKNSKETIFEMANEDDYITREKIIFVEKKRNQKKNLPEFFLDSGFFFDKEWKLDLQRQTKQNETKTRIEKQKIVRFFSLSLHSHFLSDIIFLFFFHYLNSVIFSSSSSFWYKFQMHTNTINRRLRVSQFFFILNHHQQQQQHLDH